MVNTWPACLLPSCSSARCSYLDPNRWTSNPVCLAALTLGVDGYLPRLTCPVSLTQSLCLFPPSYRLFPRNLSRLPQPRENIPHTKAFPPSPVAWTSHELPGDVSQIPRSLLPHLFTHACLNTLVYTHVCLAFLAL